MRNSTGGTAGSAPPAARKAGDLPVRAVSALVLGPATLGVVWLGGVPFLILVGVGAVLSVHEWQKMLGGEWPHPLRWASSGLVVLSLLVLLWWGPLAALGLAVAGGGAMALSRGGLVGRLAGLAIPYTVMAAVALVCLRLERFSGDLAVFLFLLLSVWACDIGAYAAGRLIGGPRLAPRVSPSKTWAGLAGGMVSAALVGAGFVVLAIALPVPFPYLVGAFLAVAAQAGDLLESVLKRHCKVKDSGHLIPGHGGVLDRIDGLMVAAPVLALFHVAIGMGGAW